MNENAIQKFQDIGWSHPLDDMVFCKQAVMDIFNEKSVLDIGCGSGALLEKIKEAHPNCAIKGIDISPKAVELCKKRGIDVEMVDISGKLPFRDKSFESILLIDVLEHMFQPLDVLAEATRISSKAVYISVPNFASLPARIQVLLGRVPENNTLRKGHVVWFTLKVLKSMLEKSNLDITDIEYNPFWKRSVITKILANIWPSLFSLSFVVKACPRS